MTGNELERFHVKTRVEQRPGVDVELGPCLIWTGSLQGGHYGQMKRDHERVPTLAHRLAYEHYVGPLLPGFDIDHLCRQTDCVQHGHLEQVTHAENIRRGVRSFRTLGTCLSGRHPIADGLYVSPKGKRQCKLCCEEARLERVGRAA